MSILEIFESFDVIWLELAFRLQNLCIFAISLPSSSLPCPAHVDLKLAGYRRIISVILDLGLLIAFSSVK
jgi:hypothetical protein